MSNFGLRGQITNRDAGVNLSARGPISSRGSMNSSRGAMDSSRISGGSATSRLRAQLGQPNTGMKFG